MDDKRFDNLTRALGFATSRRQVLRTVTGTAAGGLLGALGLRRRAAADEGSDPQTAATKSPRLARQASACYEMSRGRSLPDG